MPLGSIIRFFSARPFRTSATVEIETQVSPVASENDDKTGLLEFHAKTIQH